VFGFPISVIVRGAGSDDCAMPPSEEAEVIAAYEPDNHDMRHWRA
jgi:hypothetical protein